jgi:L-ribulose-5-phosphate 3-epimerase UlaE
MEIMDYPLMNSISKALGYAHYLNNPWFHLKTPGRVSLTCTATMCPMPACSSIWTSLSHADREIMDYPLMNSISKALGYAHYLNNPWFQLYPDIGSHDVPHAGLQLHLDVVIPRRQIADIGIKLEPRIIQVMGGAAGRHGAHRGGARQRYPARRL